MYTKIVNPNTGRKVSTKSKLGQKILRKYINSLYYINKGGGVTKGNLMKNKHGRIVKKKKHALGKKALKHLHNAASEFMKGLKSQKGGMRTEEEEEASALLQLQSVAATTGGVMAGKGGMRANSSPTSVTELPGEELLAPRAALPSWAAEELSPEELEANIVEKTDELEEAEKNFKDEVEKYEAAEKNLKDDVEKYEALPQEYGQWPREAHVPEDLSDPARRNALLRYSMKDVLDNVDAGRGRPPPLWTSHVSVASPEEWYPPFVEAQMSATNIDSRDQAARGGWNGTPLSVRGTSGFHPTTRLYGSSSKWVHLDNGGGDVYWYNTGTGASQQEVPPGQDPDVPVTLATGVVRSTPEEIALLRFVNWEDHRMNRERNSLSGRHRDCFSTEHDRECLKKFLSLLPRYNFADYPWPEEEGDDW